MKALYVHVPFCRKKCPYCSFFSQENVEQADRYLAAVEKELSFYAGRIREPLTSIYVGGGTPTLLSERQLSCLFTNIHRHFSTRSAEITIEANPGTIDAGKAQLLVEVGVTRVSIGVQSLCNSELVTLGRIHSAEDACRAVAVMKEAGIPHLSVDVMCALPGQSLATLRQTLSGVVGMPVDHVSCYCLHVEEGTVFGEQQKRGELAVPEDDCAADLYEYGVAFLARHGFEQYEISNFARNGCVCRHNMAYWNYEDFLGVGAGATSMLNGKRWTTACSIAGYIENAPYPDREEETLTSEIRVAEAVMMGLRKKEGLYLPSFSQRFGIDLIEEYHCQIQEFTNLSLMEIAGEWLRLTDRGLMLANTVLERFIP